MLTRTLPALPVFCLLLITGCRDAKIRSYTIAKEERRPIPTPVAPMSGTVDRGAPPALHWQAPEGWQQQTGSSMRVASFAITAPDGRRADMAVTTFPGDVGGDFANVNRWRGQLQLTPIAEAELPAALAQLDLPAGHFQQIDIVSDAPLIDGKQKARILGAWLKQPERTWFFKLAGEDTLVASQRDAFLNFLRTVRFDAAGSATAGAVPDNAPPSPAPATTAPASDAPENSLTWTPPASWTPKPLGQMRRGSFAAGDADVSITMFGAATNPLLENINRWRRQIALPPLAENELPSAITELAAGDLKFTVIDFTHNSSRVVGAILYRGEEAWFFKLSGPGAAVGPQKDAFIDFLKTVKAR